MPSEVVSAVSKCPQMLYQTIRNQDLQHHYHQPPLFIFTSPHQAEVRYPALLTCARDQLPLERSSFSSTDCGRIPRQALSQLTFRDCPLGDSHQRIFRPLRPCQLSLFERLAECFTTTHRNVWIPEGDTGKRATTYTVLPVPASWSLPA